MAAQRNNPIPLFMIYGLIGAAAVILLVFGWLNRDVAWGAASLFAGVTGLMVVGACLPIALAVRDWRAEAVRDRTGASPLPDSTVASRLDQVESLLAELHTGAFLSERARHIIFGDRDRQALRSVIERTIASGMLEEAARLCDSIERELGYAEDAAGGRALIARMRLQAEEERARPLLQGFETALAQRDWAVAHQAAGQIRAAMSGSAVAQSLDARIVAARDEHKRQLEDRFLDAARRDDVESAMVLLKELDKYLRRDEAERIARTAQEIITRHRDRLGAAFQQAVQERRWVDAAKQGNAIIEQYPNTKMADEVRAMIEVIRTRASQAAVAAG